MEKRQAHERRKMKVNNGRKRNNSKVRKVKIVIAIAIAVTPDKKFIKIMEEESRGK